MKIEEIFLCLLILNLNNDFQTLILDPCLDDCVMFGKKLKNLGVKVDMDILEGLPHGFLNFASVL